MKNNIEVLVVLMITFLIFVTLVVFYESKIPDYYDTTKNFSINVKVTEINNNIVTLDNVNYLETNEKMEIGNTYKIKLKPTNELIEVGNITKLLQQYKIIDIEEV